MALPPDLSAHLSLDFRNAGSDNSLKAIEGLRLLPPGNVEASIRLQGNHRVLKRIIFSFQADSYLSYIHRIGRHAINHG